MATRTVSTPIEFTSGRKSAGIRVVIDRFFGGIARFLESLAESQKAAASFDRLVRLSDSELALRGLKREDIARRVFEETYGRR